MTDDKGAGEGPYGIKNRNHWWHVSGLGEENRMNQWAYKLGAEWWASKLNAAYADGRKAERERCAKIVETENVKFYANGFISQKWKMCSEIAEKIRGGQDGE